MDFSKDELEFLADGLDPRYVRDGLECETVIVALAKFVLAVGEIAEEHYWKKYYGDKAELEKLYRQAESEE